MAEFSGPRDFYDQVAKPDLENKFNSLGDRVIYTQTAADGTSFGTTVAQALFWTDYRTKIIEAKIDALLSARGVDADAVAASVPKPNLVTKPEETEETA